jgi:flagellar FliL protein
MGGIAMAEATPNTEPKTTGKSLAARLLIAGFMGTVVISECLFAYFWLPSADEVAARTEQIVDEAKQAAETINKGTSADDTVPVIEVDLGTFTVTNHRLPNESTFRTDFHLFGVIAEADRSEFEGLFKRNEHRFRDQVIVEIRNSEISDLEDATLGLIKRRFLEKSNALFGKPLLRSIIFADYTFVEL